MKEIKVLSRSSFLAQIQTHLAITKIKTIFKGSISTHYTESIGDKDTSSKSWEKHGFGVFTNSLSEQLHLNKADLVVHSFKDLPVKSSKKSKFICLNRDDPRDVLLVKKKSIRKPSLTIATSSPRRKFYLRHLDKFLPNKKFKSNSIRGNITTRLEKIILSNKHDGVFMAKAAIDRVFQYGQKINNQEFQKFKKYFNQFEYIILPLSNFPAAAAQGCIAIEYSANNKKLDTILQSINDPHSYHQAHLERKFLSRWGGGCALDIGVTIENFLDQQILFARGKDEHTKKYFHERKYLSKSKTKKVKHIFPANLKTYKMFNREPYPIKKDLSDKHILATRTEYLPKSKISKAGFLGTAGVTSWRKFNQTGVKINYSFDGFGEKYRPIERYYIQSKLKPIKLTYKKNKISSTFQPLAHYQLVPSLNEQTIDNLFLAESFYWMSYSAFKLAIQLRPDILNKKNACGPGNTYQEISKIIPKEKLNVYLSYDDFKKYELK